MKFEQYSNMSDKRKLEEIDKLVLNKKSWSSGTSFNDEEKLEHIGRILHQPMKKTDEEKLEEVLRIVNKNLKEGLPKGTDNKTVAIWLLDSMIDIKAILEK